MGRLTDRSVKNALVGRHGDGDGLQLVVSASGRRKWILRYQLSGVRRDMGLGSYPAVGLANARIAAGDARKLVMQGLDPVRARKATRKAQKPVPTFGEIARLVAEGAKQKTTNAKVRYQWDRHLSPVFCGAIWDRPVHEVTTTEVAALLRPIWRSKPEVSRKLYPAIRSVFDHARVVLRDDHAISMPENPARWDDLKAVGFQAPPKLSQGNYPSLPYPQVPAFMADLRTQDSVAARALEFLILTNVRTNAARKATRSEFDLDQAIWTVPLANLKDRKHRKEGFRVPLSPRAVEIVAGLLSGHQSQHLFPSYDPRNPLSDMAMLAVIRRMNKGSESKWTDPKSNRPITAHGFRASFRTWAEETTGFPHAIVEQAMGHRVGAEVERSYIRTDMLNKRSQLMNAWANFVASSLETGGKVLRMRGR